MLLLVGAFNAAPHVYYTSLNLGRDTIYCVLLVQLILASQLQVTS